MVQTEMKHSGDVQNESGNEKGPTATSLAQHASTPSTAIGEAAGVNKAHLGWRTWVVVFISAYLTQVHSLPGLTG